MSARRSTAHRRSGAIEASRTQPVRELPRYEPLSHPLNATAQRKLTNLLNTYAPRELDEHLNQAISCLQDNAFGATENLTNETQSVQKQRARFTKQNPDDETEASRIETMETELEDMRARVERMTKQMDEKIRKIIDEQSFVGHIGDTIREVSESMPSTQGQTQTQGRSSRRRRNDNNEDDDEEDDPYLEFTPTDPAGGPTQASQVTRAPSTAFRTKLSQKRDRYLSYSLGQRYSTNKDYKAFRSGWHEASYTANEHAPPVPHENTWFPDPSIAAPGTTIRGGGDNEDSDDDIAVQRESISTKCPLTLMEFVDPVTSTKCPHSFEREAILGLLEQSGNHVGGQRGRGAEKLVQCPVPGCVKMLTKDDLGSDVVLKRKIARLQRAAREVDEDEERGVVNVRSSPARSGGDVDDGSEVDVDEDEVGRRKRVKIESSRRSQRQRSLEMSG